jgi:sugar/nucleoside kinase (ribokinase family)
LDMISFGSVFLELVFGHVPGLPRPGEEVFTEEFAVSCGGAVSSASAAASAGARAGLCTILGDDLGSRVVMEHCARVGVDLSPSLRVRYRSAGITVVLNFEGDRAFVTNVPTQARGGPAEIDRWRAVLRRTRPRWCYLHAGRGVPDFLRGARELGTKIALDVSLGDERHRDVVIDCIRLADVFIPNEDELLRLTGADALGPAVSAAAPWGTPLVVKRGAAGAVIAGPGGMTEVAEGIAPVTVRDLTGAGDAFAGAMIAALLRGIPLAEAVVAANAAGSEAVGRLGAVGEVEVAGISTAGQTPGARFIDQVATASQRGSSEGKMGRRAGPRRRAGDTASRRGAVPPGLRSEERATREGGASRAPRRRAGDTAAAQHAEGEPDQ